MAVVDITQVNPSDIAPARENAPGVPKLPLPAALQGKPTPQTPPWAITRYGKEALNQGVGAAKGVYETGKTAVGAVEALDPFSLESLKTRKEQLGKVGEAAKGVVKAPVRALQGKPQEGYPQDSAPTGLARPFDAVDLVLGGDPGKARLLEKSGDTAGSVAALSTGPLLLGAASKLIPDKAKPPFGPQPKSSIPPMRENIPPTVSAPFERGMRTARPGAYLNEYERVKKLTSVIGTSDKVNVPEALKVVMPELDKTARQYAIPPKGPVATEGVTERPGTGKGVRPVETLNNLMETTMGRLEGEYQSILGPAGTQQVSTNPIADAIAAQKTPGLVDMAAAAPNSEAANTVKYLDEAEAAFRNKMLPLRSLDDLRQYYYTASRAGEAGRIATRSNEAHMADTATENGLRNLIYDELEQRAQAAGKDPGFIRDLKKKQANMYSLLDLGKPNATGYINTDALVRGQDWIQRQNFTVAAHPPFGRLVGSLHGLGKKLAGDPESLIEKERLVRKSFAQKGVPNTKTGKTAQAVAKGAKTTASVAAAGSITERKQHTKTPPTGKTIKIKTPVSDETVEIPADQLEHYKSLGAQVVQ